MEINLFAENVPNQYVHTTEQIVGFLILPGRSYQAYIRWTGSLSVNHESIRIDFGQNLDAIGGIVLNFFKGNQWLLTAITNEIAPANINSPNWWQNVIFDCQDQLNNLRDSVGDEIINDILAGMD